MGGAKTTFLLIVLDLEHTGHGSYSSYIIQVGAIGALFNKMAQAQANFISSYKSGVEEQVKLNSTCFVLFKTGSSRSWQLFRAKINSYFVSGPLLVVIAVWGFAQLDVPGACVFTFIYVCMCVCTCVNKNVIDRF